MQRRSRQMVMLALAALLLVAAGCQSRRSGIAQESRMQTVPVPPPYDWVGPYAISTVADSALRGHTADTNANDHSVFCYLLARYQPRLNTDTTGPAPILEIDSLWLQVRDSTIYPEVSIQQDLLVQLWGSTVQGRLFTVGRHGWPVTDSLPMIIKYVASVRDPATGQVLATARFRHMMAANGGEWWTGPTYPNPFSPTTTISYSLPVAGPVKLTIYNVLGNAVRTLVDKWQAPGEYEINWDGLDSDGFSVDSGVYFYKLEAGEFIQTKKMVLLK